MIEFEKFAKEQLSKLPQNHPDRAGVSAIANLAEAWNTRRNGTQIAETLPSKEQLVTSEKEAWSRFLGKEVHILNPPQEILDTLAKAKEQGVNVFEAHYLPPIEFKENSRFSGWKIKPEEWYWEQIKAGKVAKDAAKLGGSWVLIDGSTKPNYHDGRQLYAGDPFAPVFSQLRQEGKIPPGGNTPDNSRFRISWDEIEKVVLPQITQLLRVSQGQVRLPREIEFNVLGNLYHPEWGQTSTWEWLHDKFRGVDRLVGGSSGRGGLAGVDCSGSGARDGGLGFRPLVVFSSKS